MTDQSALHQAASAAADGQAHRPYRPPGPAVRTPSPRPLSCRPGGATWALPANDTIAAVARMSAAGELAALEVTGELADDVEVMVSELATNALQHAAHSPDGTMRPIATMELWMYRKLTRNGHELVVSIFDRSPERPHPALPGATALDAENGRGLMLVEAMSNGRWGSYPTRSRLAGPVVRGKVTWFAIPLPAGPDGFASAAWEHDETEAATTLQALLAPRGFDNLILQIRPEPHSRLAVLSVATGLTVWCQNGYFRWNGPRTRRRLPLADITAATEEIIALHEAAGLDGTPA